MNSKCEPGKPCSECPFRRESLGGWLGAHKDASEITELVRSGKKFPCHLSVNQLQRRDKMGFEEAVICARHCQGALLFMNNRSDTSPNAQIATQQRKVGKSDAVFLRDDEMIQHHRAGPKLKNTPTKSPEAGHCFKCGEACEEGMFCYGCQTHICEKCDINDRMPMGPHSANLHLDPDGYE